MKLNVVFICFIVLLIGGGMYETIYDILIKDKTSKKQFPVMKESTTKTSPIQLHKNKFKNLKPKKPIIVLWNQRAKMNMETPMINCGGGCALTKNRQLVERADAVVVQMKWMGRDTLPPRSSKNKNQLIVWYNRESTWTMLHKYKINLTQYDNFFNWTMTYRRDSNVNAMMIPHHALPFVISRNIRVSSSNLVETRCPPSNLTNDDLQKILAKKSKTVVWAVGNCKVTQGARQRMTIVQELKQCNISFDIYGKCFGSKYLPTNDFYSTLSNYMFYLAFENSYHCKDYVTEKLWYNSFYVGLVPIIWGPLKSDLENMLPKNSYIYLEDFANASALVSYLKYLKHNETAFFEYFKWRLKEHSCYYPLFNVNDSNIAKNLMLRNNNKINGFCNLCKMLNDKEYTRTPNVISSLAKLWLHDERRACID